MQIPNKSQFKIEEVSSITGVKSYVLRFWESEFEQISPTLSSTGHKVYDYHDVEMVALIKKLLFEDKMTIEQAKKELDALARVVNSVSSTERQESDSDTPTGVEVDSKQGSGIAAKTDIFEGHEHHISDGQLQKLVLAKAKLESLLDSIRELL